MPFNKPRIRLPPTASDSPRTLPGSLGLHTRTLSAVLLAVCTTAAALVLLPNLGLCKGAALQVGTEADEALRLLRPAFLFLCVCVVLLYVALRRRHGSPQHFESTSRFRAEARTSSHGRSQTQSYGACHALEAGWAPVFAIAHAEADVRRGTSHPSRAGHTHGRVKFSMGLGGSRL
ncbi:hypothetical protein FB45DRAFT_906279 [Roridomyces roridus]|uniref:Uncharacterized protein n=1 Tax=Roridomyces roridus TaxID=1738132 RepID=A0AAD7C132_9AGAR|nr:hypothetical protein FB45DRAFT_906279 [Roridomyces roridus]